MEPQNPPPHDRRIHHRVNANLPVNIDQMSGQTIDVSPGGFYLELDYDLDTQQKHYFEIRLATDEPVYLTGVAMVVRKEKKQAHYYMGMQIVQSKIQVH